MGKGVQKVKLSAQDAELSQKKFDKFEPLLEQVYGLSAAHATEAAPVIAEFIKGLPPKTTEETVHEFVLADNFKINLVIPATGGAPVRKFT